MGNNILNELCINISDLYNLDIELIKANMSKSLLDEPFYWQSEKLLYLFFYLQDKYKIKFEKKDLLDYQFTSIENIAKVVNSHI